MTSKKSNQEYPIHVIREQLRQSSTREAERLARSVGRLTSYDALPCPEYRQEVAQEYETVERLLYVQQCRSCLEVCIDSGFSSLRYRWRSGQVTETAFRRIGPGRVRVSGLLAQVA